MNPFQRARDEALALRVKLIEAQAENSISSTLLIEHIERKLNLGIAKLPKSASELGNGDACLVWSDKYIYIRNDVDDDQYAALIAHELGHWVLDVDKTQQTITTLSLLENSQGSPGVVKVEAYGARERQELQANVFGREFLLPRGLAKKLFEAGLGANQVAKDLCIPLNIVQQQMLDAILLPEDKSEHSKTLDEPSDDQKQAAYANERFVNVVAGPGTGKTSTLINRIKYLVEELEVDPSHILVLTFTNKAAFELVERLRATGLQRAADIWAGTFHGFGLEFLRKYHDAFSLPNDLLVADKLNSITMLARELPNISLQRYLRVEDPYEWLGSVSAAISRLKEELVSPAQYRERIHKLKCDDEKLLAFRQDVATLYEVHDRVLRAAGLVDFSDLVALPAISIRDDRARFSEWADKFQYVLVDEYQDVTKSMVELVRQLAHKAKSLWVVGDVRQAIHHWRGASVQSLLKFESVFSEQASSDNSIIQKYSLKLNRRSSQEIVDFIQTAGESHVLQEQLPLEKTKSTSGTCGVMPKLISCASRLDIPEAISNSISNFNKEGISFSQQAVLCRKTADVELIAEELQRRGIPTLYLGELSHRSNIKKILCLMHLIVERQPRALIGLTAVSNLCMPISDINQVLELAEKDLNYQRGRWLAKPPSILSNDSTNVVLELASLIDRYTYHSNPWNFICHLLLEKRFGFPLLTDQSIEAQVERLAVWQFAYSVRAGDGDGKRPSIARYLLRRQLRQRIGENFMEREIPHEAISLDAVRIQTVHGSKGLEYQAVHVGYVDDVYSDKKPGWKPDDDLIDIVPPEVLDSSVDNYDFEQAIERNNLFYVAVSRAKNRLNLYEDAKYSSKNRPSQLGHIPKMFQEVSFSSPSNLTKTVNKAIASTQDQILSFEQFETYARCPLQYHYRYAMHLKREQEYELSLKARFAVMGALKLIVSKTSQKQLETLEKSWSDNQLPTKAEDPTLWRDAAIIFNRGVALIDDSYEFFEPITDLAGLKITLPWLMKKKGQYGDLFKVIRFSNRGAKNMQTLLRPMILGIDKNIRMELVNLITNDLLIVEPSKSPNSTNAMVAATKFQTQNFEPSKGLHCKYCSYSILCPINPEI